MKAGDLVRLYESGETDIETYTVGTLDWDDPGWVVPGGTIALVTKIIPDRNGDITCHLLVNGKVGWAYKEDCVVIDESR